MKAQKLFLVGVSLIATLAMAGCETKENHEKNIDASSNSVRGPQDFSEDAQKQDNQELKRVPANPQRDPNNPSTNQHPDTSTSSTPDKQ